VLDQVILFPAAGSQARPRRLPVFEREMTMAIGDIPSGYWSGPRPNRQSIPSRAEAISKSAWMDLYYDLFAQTHGEDATNQATVLADAERRLKILKANGIRR